jgi:hypothetical protein
MARRYTTVKWNLKSQADNKQKLLLWLFQFAFITQLFTACSILQPTIPADDLASRQHHLSANAELAILELEEIDTLIRLDNKWLSRQIIAELNELSEADEKYSFDRIRITFNRQYIALSGIVNILDDDKNIVTAVVRGDIQLDFNNTRLDWTLRFDQLQVTSRDFTYEDGSYAEPIPELSLQLLNELNSEVSESLSRRDANTIAFNPVPLGQVEVGASLPGFSHLDVSTAVDLRGIFMVTGSAMLIDSSVTTVALDLSFIPDLSECPADVTVSRAEFASDIQSREPVGIIGDDSPVSDIRYFFSEIRGAKQPLSVIHYWFADGQPVGIEELSVGQSERWRTWSGKSHGHDDATRWDVLVVEKQSGCILLSSSTGRTDYGPALTRVSTTEAKQGFTALNETFNARISEFTIVEEKPVIALVETDRSFLREVLQSSLKDFSIAARFDDSAMSAQQFEAGMQPFDTGKIVCEHRDCPPAPACKTVITQCKRLRDTRDCSSCLFRNPLNNRCISEATDPLCEASRSRQNAKYENERLACIDRAETSKRECDQLNAQVLRSCQIESGFEDSACQSTRASIEALKPGEPLARLNTRASLSGSLSVNFSNFRIDGDLERLQLDMSVQSDIQVSGEISLTPGNIGRALANCMAAWGKPFRSRFANTPVVNKLISNLGTTDNSLTAHWSGFGLNIDTKPSPLESVLVGNPQLLANCKIGLTVEEVEDHLAGADAEFFRGQMELEILPLPTNIHLAPVTIQSGDMTHSAAGQLSARFLRFDLED